jgi:hypothetical protein
MKALMIAAIMPAPITTPTGGHSAHARPIREHRGSRIETRPQPNTSPKPGGLCNDALSIATFAGKIKEIAIGTVVRDIVVAQVLAPITMKGISREVVPYAIRSVLDSTGKNASPDYRTIILISAGWINPFYATKFYMCSRIIERPLERQMSHSSNVVKQTADVARCGFGHSCILLRGAAGVVVFQPSGLWSTLLSLKTLDRYWRTSNSYSLAVGFK